MALALLLNVSCRNGEEVVTLPKGDYENGILMANEGNFGRPNADLSFVTSDLSKVDQNIYSFANKENLGDVLQSVGFHGDKAYLVVNNSNKVVVANRYTMKKEAEVTNEVNQPRYIAFARNSYYVTNSSTRKVTIYDVSSNALVGEVPIGKTVERIVEAGGNLFVQNAAWGRGNQITVISSSTHAVSSTITLPEGQLNKIVSRDGLVYAIAGGKDNSYVYQISSDGKISKTVTLKGIVNANNLEVDASNFYFTSGVNVYVMPKASTSVPAPAFTVSNTGWSALYAFNVIDGKIYTSDASGFTQDSKVSVYSAAGTLLKEFTAGMGTNAFYKN